MLGFILLFFICCFFVLFDKAVKKVNNSLDVGDYKHKDRDDDGFFPYP